MADLFSILLHEECGYTFHSAPSQKAVSGKLLSSKGTVSDTTTATETFTGFVDSAILFEDYAGSRSLYLSGWMLTGSGPLATLSLSLPGCEAVIAQQIDRADVAARNAHLAHALHSGFQASLPVAELSPEFHVTVQAQTVSGNSIISTISVKPSWSSPTHRVAKILLSQVQQAELNNLPRPSLQDKRAELIEICKLRLKAFLETEATLFFSPAAQPLLSVIIPVSDEPHFTLSCLETLLAHELPEMQIVVVDCGRSDETREILTRVRNVTYIRGPSDFNFSKACNIGAAVAAGEYLLFLNNDAFPLSNAITRALDTITQSSSCGVVGAMLLRPDGLLQEVGSFILPNGSTIGRGRATASYQISHPFPLEVDYCSAAFLITPNELFRTLGGFNEAFTPAYYEDVDYCVRATKAGYTCIVEPRAEVLHVERGSTNIAFNVDDLIRKNRELFISLHPDYATHTKKPRAQSNEQKISSVLVIDDCIPDRSRGQGQARACLMLETLHELNLSVSWYPVHSTQRDQDNRQPHTTGSNGFTVVTPKKNEPTCDFIKRVMPNYDLLLVSRPHHMEQVQIALRSRPETHPCPKIIYDAEAVHSQREILRYQLRNGHRLSGEEVAGIVCNELIVAKDANQILASSKHEASLFAEFGFSAPIIVSHGIRPKPSKATFADRTHFLTVGPLLGSHTPNVDGLQWFLEDVMPLVVAHSNVSNVMLHSVGDCRVASLTEMQGTHFQLLGRIVNLESVYERYRVCIAPTRFSAGIPLKVLEAAAYGVPSVITPLLAHQLEWEDGVEVLVGHDPSDFAAKCVALYTNIELWQSIRNAALKRVSQDYSVESFKQAFMDALA
jgi:GT2 family glycosyltransferase